MNYILYLVVLRPRSSCSGCGGGLSRLSCCIPRVPSLNPRGTGSPGHPGGILLLPLLLLLLPLLPLLPLLLLVGGGKTSRIQRVNEVDFLIRPPFHWPKGRLHYLIHTSLCKTRDDKMGKSKAEQPVITLIVAGWSIDSRRHSLSLHSSHLLEESLSVDDLLLYVAFGLHRICCRELGIQPLRSSTA